MRTKEITGKTVLWIFLLALAFVTLIPVVITILGSFKTNIELTTGATVLPSKWHFSNYANAWDKANFSTYTMNSLIVSLTTVAGTLLVASMAAYVVDRMDFFGKKIYIGMQSFTMFVAVGAVVLRPQFDLMVKLHLHSSLWGVILILISAHASIFFILLSFMKGIPRELDEAARIDGSSLGRTFWTIILPLLGPGLGVGALFTFRGAWNEYLLPLVFTMTKPELQTLTVGLANLKYGISAASQTHYMMAGACLSILPILVAYVFANKSFMQMTAGSLKG
ncbi:carbohydrate ABC transporter permease [Paenibacillus graminis]|uniref:Sugar ABC transporter permease n=1 Tax=Paenibacillus graminis TaxID=189425 RepID=A0A089M3J7_9BACL|nr:carbohydrate ABC transporter permease [Paenibacillus graminis]AIQ67782.1 sugar ABC transporter permease [Paenibacillus graminis]MEC0170094.1 carbohydrate ABC transporter permease [Paenibacillus graminis]